MAFIDKMMKKKEVIAMKRVLAILLALLMVAALASCKTKPEEPTPNPEDGAGAGESKPVLRVAMECTYAPYNWTQPNDANGAVPIKGTSDYAYGYDVMMAKIIAEALDYDLEIVKMDWDGIVPAIQSGIVDVGICGQSITADRLEMVDFSDPYYYAAIVVVVKADGPYANAKSVADLTGATVTAQLNTIWETICVPQIPKVNATPGQDTAPAMIVALTSGRVDAIVTDQPTGLAAVAANAGLTMLEFEGEGAFQVSDEEINIGVSMKKGSELREKINSVLANYTADDFKAMMDEAIAVQPLNQ